MDQREGTDPPVTPTRSRAWIAKGKFFLLANVLRKPTRTGKIQQQFGNALNWYLDDIDRRYGVWLHPILPSVFWNIYATSNDPWSSLRPKVKCSPSKLPRRRGLGCKLGWIRWASIDHMEQQEYGTNTPWPLAEKPSSSQLQCQPRHKRCVRDWSW